MTVLLVVVMTGFLVMTGLLVVVVAGVLVVMALMLVVVIVAGVLTLSFAGVRPCAALLCAAMPVCMRQQSEKSLESSHSPFGESLTETLRHVMVHDSWNEVRS